MTYMQAPPEEWTPYLQKALRPLRPVVLAGVNAKTWMGEWKPPQVAVMQWWKAPASAERFSHVVLPLCAESAVEHALPRRALIASEPN